MHALGTAKCNEVSSSHSSFEGLHPVCFPFPPGKMFIHFLFLSLHILPLFLSSSLFSLDLLTSLLSSILCPVFSPVFDQFIYILSLDSVSKFCIVFSLEQLLKPSFQCGCYLFNFTCVNCLLHPDILMLHLPLFHFSVQVHCVRCLNI